MLLYSNILNSFILLFNHIPTTNPLISWRVVHGLCLLILIFLCLLSCPSPLVDCHVVVHQCLSLSSLYGHDLSFALALVADLCYYSTLLPSDKDRRMLHWLALLCFSPSMFLLLPALSLLSLFWWTTHPPPNIEGPDFADVSPPNIGACCNVSKG